MTGAIRRSTPFRLTVRLMGVFALSMLVCFAVAFWAIRGYLDADLHAQVAQELATWSETGDASDLAERVAEAVRVTPPRATLIALTAPDGRRIGNVPDFGPVKGFRVVSADEIAADDLADSYLVSAAPVAGGTIMIGRDREKVSELGEIFTMIFLLGVLPTLVIVAGLGLVTAQLARRRVEAIDVALAAITAGDLTARVPVGDRDDDLVRIGAAVNRMAVAQSASVESLKQISSDIAHDLKTPIQRVSVLLDLLEGAGPLTEAQAAALDRARTETRGIVATFQSLLQIAQIEGGSPRARFEAVDLAATVAGIAEVYAPSAEDSDHHLDVRVPPGPVMVLGDRNLLNQITANLIENALRHTPAGSRIALEVTPGAVLTVADNGAGIPEHERENVLRRLYRLERSRTSEGSGLGLALVAAIAALHEAELTLEEAGPGLRVRIRFRQPEPSGAEADETP